MVMNPGTRRPERPTASSLEELVRVVRKESAAALTEAKTVFADPTRERRLDVPRRFPSPAAPLDEPEFVPPAGRW